MFPSCTAFLRNIWQPLTKRLPSTYSYSVRCSAPAELQSANRWITLCRSDAWLSFASVLDALGSHSLLFIAPKCLSTWWERFSLRGWSPRVGGGRSGLNTSPLLSCNPSHYCYHRRTINERGSWLTLSSPLAHLKPRPFSEPKPLLGGSQSSRSVLRNRLLRCAVLTVGVV